MTVEVVARLEIWHGRRCYVIGKQAPLRLAVSLFASRLLKPEI
jgi:hypothetical protein